MLAFDVLLCKSWQVQVNLKLTREGKRPLPPNARHEAIKYKSHQNYPGTIRNHTWRNLRVGRIAPNDYQQPHAGYFMSIELRYHPLIPNRTCQSWNCPAFEGVRFGNISVISAGQAGDINVFKGDLLEGLVFKNVTFQETPKQSWSCGFVNLTTFVAEDVVPPLSCVSDGRLRLRPCDDRRKVHDRRAFHQRRT